MHFRNKTNVDLFRFINNYPYGICRENCELCPYDGNHNVASVKNGTRYYYTSCHSVITDAIAELELRKKYQKDIKEFIPDSLIVADENIAVTIKKEKKYCLFTLAYDVQFYTAKSDAAHASAILRRKNNHMKFSVTPINWGATNEYGGKLAVYEVDFSGDDHFYTIFLDEEMIDQKNSFRNEVHEAIKKYNGNVNIIPALSEYDFITETL